MNVLKWQQAYVKQAIEDEIALVAVHPKYRRKVIKPKSITVTTLLEFVPSRGNTLMSAGVLRSTFEDRPPQWRRSWSAAGTLIGELGLNIRHDQDEGTVSVGTGSRRRSVTESYADHPGVDEAVNAALVRAAIQIFTEGADE